MDEEYGVIEQAQAIVNIYELDKTCFMLNASVGQHTAMKILTEGFKELLKNTQGETQ